MKTYLTEHKIFRKKNTPNIRANSWNEAVKKCPKNHRVIGELRGTRYINEK